MPDDILQLATTTFCSTVKAEIWLRTPIQELSGDTPLVRLKTDHGADEIRRILRKIECGEFS